MTDNNINIQRSQPNTISFEVTIEARELDDALQEAHRDLESYFEDQARALADGSVTRDIDRTDTGFKVTVTITFAS